jgi:hypothetical protein
MLMEDNPSPIFFAALRMTYYREFKRGESPLSFSSPSPDRRGGQRG